MGFAIGAGIAIGFASLGCGIGQGILAGNTTASESGEESDLFLAKFAPSGILKWIHQPGFGRPVKAVVLQLKKLGQLSLSGLSHGENNSAVIQSTYDLNGKKIFSKLIEISGTASGNGMAMDSEGHIYASAAVPFNLMKIHTTGEKMWSTELNSGINLQAIAADSGTGLYITGSMNSSLDGIKSTGGTDVFLIKMSQSCGVRSTGKSPPPKDMRQRLRSKKNACPWGGLPCKTCFVGILYRKKK